MREYYNKNSFKIGINFFLLILNLIFFSNYNCNYYIKESFINQTIHDNNNLTQGRIFLCTLYNNEAAMAYIQIWRLYNYIDKFIIVTSNITHSGKAKNISFNLFEKDIRPYMDKIDIISFSNICNKKEYPHSDTYWCIEKSQLPHC